MKKTRLALATLLLMGHFINAFATESEYNVDSKILTIPTVKIGNGFVYDATLKLNDAGSFDIIGYSENPSVGGAVDSKCTEDKITLDNFNQISDGMTLEQVNSIIGCEGELTLVHSSGDFYKWKENALPQIRITFRNNAIISKAFQP